MALNGRFLKEENEKLIQEIQENQIVINQLESERDCAIKRNAEINVNLKELNDNYNNQITENLALKQQAKDLQKQLDSFTNVKTVIDDLKKSLSAPNTAVEDKNKDLQSRINRLENDLQFAQQENRELMQDLKQIGYLTGKVEAYERMPMLNATPMYQGFREPVNND